MSMQLQAVLFDLDGVIVDTAKYHYLAWKMIADQEGIPFDEHINERLKGVSRMASLDIILEKGKRVYSEQEKLKLAQVKNDAYVEMIGKLKPEEILPGVKNFLVALRDAGIKRAICSASKNAVMILDRLELTQFFDTIVSGNDTSRSKPDPEVFTMAAERFKLSPANCLVVEDAFAGVQGAKAGGMQALGIGDAKVLNNADMVYSSTGLFNLAEIKAKLFA